MLKFLNALAALATVGTFIIAFLNSYEVRIKVRRRTLGLSCEFILGSSSSISWVGLNYNNRLNDASYSACWPFQGTQAGFEAQKERPPSLRR